MKWRSCTPALILSFLLFSCSREPEELFTLSINLATTECRIPCTVTPLSFSEHIKSYDWNFGDGAFSSEPVPAHTYWEPGSYQISLTVETTQGQILRDTASLDVYPPYLPDGYGLYNCWMEHSTDTLLYSVLPASDSLDQLVLKKADGEQHLLQWYSSTAFYEISPAFYKISLDFSTDSTFHFRASCNFCPNFFCKKASE